MCLQCKVCNTCGVCPSCGIWRFSSFTAQAMQLLHSNSGLPGTQVWKVRSCACLDTLPLCICAHGLFTLCLSVILLLFSLVFFLNCTVYIPLFTLHCYTTMHHACCYCVFIFCVCVCLPFGSDVYHLRRSTVRL